MMDKAFGGITGEPVRISSLRVGFACGVLLKSNPQQSSVNLASDTVHIAGLIFRSSLIHSVYTLTYAFLSFNFGNKIILAWKA